MKKETYVSLQKPKPFIASGSQTPITEEDKDVPEELIKQIKEFEKTYLKEKPYKKETTKWN